MAELSVARTYADALFQVAKEQDIIDEIWTDLLDVRRVFEANPDLMKFLASPAISMEDKVKETCAIFDGQVSQTFLNFLCVLIEKARVNQYVKISREYMNLVDDYRDLAYGKIYSAVPLTEEQIKKFEEETGRLIGEKVELKNEIDSSLIGGVSIQVDGKLIDASIKTRIAKLADSLAQQANS